MVRFGPVSIAVAIILGWGPEADAQDPCRPIVGGFQWGVGSIGLVGFGEGRSPDLFAMGGGAAMWNQCAGLPEITTTSSADHTVSIIFHAGANDGRVASCGVACGCFVNGEIHVFEANSDWSRDCTQTWASLVAHEVGHYLGLGNALAGCGCVIMGGTSCGPTVLPADCDAAGELWVTPEEAPEPEEEPDNTPLLIDLDRRGFKLTDLEGGVVFEIRPGYAPTQVSWTAPGSRDGFLAVDINRNGRVDNGRELFGNYSPQPPSDDPNGFRALAMYDEARHGGNGDGLISSKDRIFDYLLIWVDENHDGVSSPAELLHPSEHGIIALNLDYRVSRRRDRHGNEFRYKSWAQRGDRKIAVVDVFLLK